VILQEEEEIIAKKEEEDPYSFSNDEILLVNDDDETTLIQQEEEEESGKEIQYDYYFVDVENVRGKLNFQESHESLILRICKYYSSTTRNIDYIQSNNNNDNKKKIIKVVLFIMDHGNAMTLQSDGPLSSSMSSFEGGGG